MRRELIILLLIVFVGLILRFYNLGEIPYGFHRDEAYLGYNAYSILQTTKDINGAFLPLHLESFLYSPAGYSYFSIPFVSLFGLSSFSTRFASAFFGSFSIFLVYVLGSMLFSFSRYKKAVSLVSAFLFAVSPWSIVLSRTATENVLVVFFLLLGTILFIRFYQKNNIYFLLFSFLSFVLTLFLYQAPRAFLPFYIPLLFFAFGFVKKRKQMFLMSVLFVILILFPIFLIVSSTNLSLRIRTVSIFASTETPLKVNEQIREEGENGIGLMQTRIFHNKAVGFIGDFLDNYFSHFSYSFFFTDVGFPDRYRVPLGSLLFVVQLPFLLIGTWFLLKNDTRVATFLLGWVFISPLGSALTFDDVPNLQRTLLMLPPLLFLTAFGVVQSYRILKKKKIYKIVFYILLCIFLYQMVFYFRQYFIHYSLYRPWYRQDGYKELVEKVNAQKGKYKNIAITNSESGPTIFFLFYSKYDPLDFQKQTAKSTMRDFDRVGFGSYEFSTEECPLTTDTSGKLKGERGVLYINNGVCKTAEGVRVVGEVKRKDDSTVFRFVDIP